ncbi:GlsB/YeaQ/YmgE family stress response membrane protein [Brachybacterium hainanense]|uniref:GlsB/YeaQ/YmgE family stress response membrane protein n=1 Tax=Brachybacterium hainanense TaxID=1541174 RepID=A0ABV6RD72_9MICO
MVVIGWIIVGLLAGALAKLVIPGKQGGGWIATAALGVVGAFIGGLLFGIFGTTGVGSVLSDPWSWGSLVTAVLGAVVLSFAWGLLTSDEES